MNLLAIETKREYEIVNKYVSLMFTAVNADCKYRIIQIYELKIFYIQA